MRRLICIVVASPFLVACSPASTPPPTALPLVATHTSLPTVTPSPPSPTASLEPTATDLPTLTPTLAATLKPTAIPNTVTPIPAGNQTWTLGKGLPKSRLEQGAVLRSNRAGFSLQKKFISR